MAENHALHQALRGETVVDGVFTTDRDFVPLHDPRPKEERNKLVVIKEQPWHRLLAYQLLQGRPVTELSKQFDVTRQTIYNVKNQPWFKDLIAVLAQDTFENDISGLLEGGAVEAILNLQELASNANSEAVRAQSSKALLDSYLRAKPERKAPAPKDPQEELKQLDAEINRLEEGEVTYGNE